MLAALRRRAVGTCWDSGSRAGMEIYDVEPLSYDPHGFRIGGGSWTRSSRGLHDDDS
jgi:hypothetical protein